MQFNWLLVASLLTFLICEKEAEPAVLPSAIPAPPQTQLIRSVRIVVGAGLSLNNVKAYSQADSLAMDQATKTIKVPRGMGMALFFTNRTTQEVLSMVRVDSTQQEVTISVATVTHGLFDLLPAYSLLSSEQQKKFDR